MNFYTSVSRALTPNKTSGSMDTLRHKLVMPTALMLACLLVEPPHGSVAIFGLATPSTPTSKGKVQANGITIAYESFGPADRETVLLIMGTGGQLTAWPVELCEELVKRGYVSSGTTIATSVSRRVSRPPAYRTLLRSWPPRRQARRCFHYQLLVGSA